jgi:hypothetical protein
VFRFTNIMNMQCVLQLRVTYCKSIKLLHSTADGSYLLSEKESFPEISPAISKFSKISEETCEEVTTEGSGDDKEKKEESKEVKITTSSSTNLNNNDSKSLADDNKNKKPVFQSSRCFVILEKETQTSSRDWRHDQTL